MERTKALQERYAARGEVLSLEQVWVFRQEKSKPVLQKFKAWVDDLLPATSPKRAGQGAWIHQSVAPAVVWAVPTALTQPRSTIATARVDCEMAAQRLNLKAMAIAPAALRTINSARQLREGVVSVHPIGACCRGEVGGIRSSIGPPIEVSICLIRVLLAPVHSKSPRMGRDVAQTVNTR